MGWLSLILGFVTGLAGPISQVTNKITDLRMAQVQAKTDVDKKQIDQQIEETHDKKAVLIAEAGNRIAGMVNVTARFMLTLPIIIILNKLFIWDKVFGSFSGCAGKASHSIGCSTFLTDPLSVMETTTISVVLGFYFLSVIANQIAGKK